MFKFCGEIVNQTRRLIRIGRQLQPHTTRRLIRIKEDIQPDYLFFNTNLILIQSKFIHKADSFAAGDRLIEHFRNFSINRSIKQLLLRRHKE